MPILVVSVLLPAAFALPAAGLLGDAGSGQDAGGSPEDAMPLAYGSYDGNLTPGDSDWFVFPASAQAACLRASVESAHAMRVGVGAGSAGFVGGLEEGHFATVLAVPPSATRLGLLPDESPWDTFSVGPYAFEAAMAAPTVLGDTRSFDAPSLPELAAPAPGDCFGAHFKEDAPDRDVWSFVANASDRATVSLAVGPDAYGLLWVTSANGTLVGGPIASGELEVVPLHDTGTYYVFAQSLWSTDDERYTIGLVVGPDPSGCRPYCLL